MAGNPLLLLLDILLLALFVATGGLRLLFLWPRRARITDAELACRKSVHWRLPAMFSE